MAIVDAKIKQWGNSLGIVIPKGVVILENLNKGDTIKIEVSKEKRIDGFGAFKGMANFVRKKEHRDDIW